MEYFLEKFIDELFTLKYKIKKTKAHCIYLLTELKAGENRPIYPLKYCLACIALLGDIFHLSDC